MRILIIGCGYSALAFAARHGGGHEIAGTIRDMRRAPALEAAGVRPLPFDGLAAGPELAAMLKRVDALIVSAPPGEAGDPLLACAAGALHGAAALRRILYLSTVGVYGDRAGAWVDEESDLRPASGRSRQRCEAEAAWQAFGAGRDVTVTSLRLSGIYGPGRNALADLAAGRARRIVKPGQVFNRIHVEDIAGAMAAVLSAPAPAAVYNVSDDEPAPPQDVVAFAAALLGVPPPPEIPFAEAELSPMARSFYAETKRVSGRRIREQLGLRLLYPSYREGLTALFAAGEGR